MQLTKECCLSTMQHGTRVDAGRHQSGPSMRLRSQISSSSSVHFSIRCALCQRDFNMQGQATRCGDITVLQCDAALLVRHAQIPSAQYAASCTMGLTHHSRDGMVAAMDLVSSSPRKATLRNVVVSSTVIPINWATSRTRMLAIASWSAPWSAAIARL